MLREILSRENTNTIEIPTGTCLSQQPVLYVSPVRNVLPTILYIISIFM
jgi:hypothetical protein